MPSTHRTVAGETIELIGDEQRVDSAWENENTDLTRAAWQEDEVARARQRHAERDRRSLGERLESALADLRAMSVVPAGRIGHQARGADSDRIGPPNHGDPAAIVEANLRVIAQHVREVESAVDRERGIDRRPVERLRPAAEKDLEVWRDWLGVHSQDVAEAAPHLGSARTVERARVRIAAEMGVRVRPVDGRVIGRSDAEVA